VESAPQVGLTFRIARRILYSKVTNMIPKLTKLQARPDLADEVYKTLLDAISDGSLAPGARITQEEIAEQLNVSRSPVLQALRLLKKDGLVQDAPGRGLVVAEMDADWIGNLYQVRGALDNLAARLAAERKCNIGMEVIAAGRKAARGNDVKAMIDADIAFHNAIYRASGNPLIIESTQLHWVHLRRVMGAVLQSAGQRESIWDEHEAIAKAILAGDVKRACELSDTHAFIARENLVSHLGKVLNSSYIDKPGRDKVRAALHA
jgi:DNA-binding GntR family transcriptional regulator